MKKFDLSAAMLGDPIETTMGRKVKFVAYVPEAAMFNQVVLMDVDGKLFSVPVAHNTIVMSKVLTTFWANVYEGAAYPFVGPLFESESDAEKFRDVARIYIKTISLEVEA
jgi:hypothetical protein